MKKIILNTLVMVSFVCVLVGCGSTSAVTEVKSIVKEDIPKEDTKEKVQKEERTEPAEEEVIETDDNFYCVWTDESKADVEEFAKTVRTLILEKDWQTLSSYCAYPVRAGGMEYDSPEAFVEAIGTANISDDFFCAVEEESCENMFSNYQGAMFGDGEVWINSVYQDDGTLDIKVITLNY